MKKRVWLNMETGKFSNSWRDGDIGCGFDSKDLLDRVDYKKTLKLIEYECLSDESFQFSNYMRIA